MSTYILLLTGFGVVVLLTAWLPMMLKEMPLSLPIVCVGIGALAAGNLELPGLAPHPQQHLKATERLTEAVVIVALMGAGLKLDRSLRWAKAVLTWRLLIVAMPLTIALIALLGSALLGLGTAAALLLGASLAPTDPVLASDVQVGPPRSGEEDEVRFTLTAEAGLNDGLAFPFVNLAIALAAASQTGEPWLLRWLTVDVLWKLACGVAVGGVVGRVLGWLTFRLPNRAKLSRTGDGFVALGITAVAYGLTELAHGYGFLAVFCAAASFRTVEQNHAYHEKLHEFIEQLERLLMMILLVLFGGAISSGNLLGTMDGAVVLFALLVLFVVRPVCGWISLAGLARPPGERGAISFFGVRGLGSAYYLAYGLGHAGFEQPERLWTAAGLVVLVSIVIHGVAVTPVMRHLDRQRERPRAGG